MLDPIAARAIPSEGEAGGTERGVLSLRAAMVREDPPEETFGAESTGACDVEGRLNRAFGPGFDMTDDWDWECPWPREGDDRWPEGGASIEAAESENGTTPARRAMSASPSCQCIASAARQGTAISSATFDHISGLNLKTFC